MRLKIKDLRLAIRFPTIQSLLADVNLWAFSFSLWKIYLNHYVHLKEAYS